jgi:TPR repeat protein
MALLAAAPVVADVVVPPAISGNRWLKDLRRSMLAGRDLSDKQLQTLADAGEGLAAARYAKRLEARKDAAFLDDAAHYYSIAVYMGRDFALPRLIALLGSPEAEFSPARLRNIQAVLERAARKGNPVAAAGLAELLLKEAPFGQDIPQARDLMLQAAQAGDAKAAIRLALAEMSGASGLPPDREVALEALELAMTSPEPGVQAMALTLSRQLSGETELAAALPPPPLSSPLHLADETTELPGEAPVRSFPPRPRPRPETLKGAAP